MKRADHLWLSGLLVAALLIWLRDLAWMPAAAETLPVLAALPLFLWLGAPWHVRPAPFHLQGRTLATGAVLLGLGLVLDWTCLIAAAWTLALWSWLHPRVVAERGDLRQLVLLPLMAFPWLTLDFTPLSWWFRISAAWTTDHLFSGLGFVVVRHGTNLLVHGLPIEVAPACSGMNALQTVLIAGIVLAWLELRGSRWFWLALATLPALAWTVNFVRICTTVAVALSWGSSFARGWIHATSGWLVLMVVCLGWWFVLRLTCHRHSIRQVPA